MPSRKQTLVGSWLLVLFLIDDLEAAPAYDIGLPLRQTTSWPIIFAPWPTPSVHMHSQEVMSNQGEKLMFEGEQLAPEVQRGVVSTKHSFSWQKEQMMLVSFFLFWGGVWQVYETVLLALAASQHYWVSFILESQCQSSLNKNVNRFLLPCHHS